MKLCSACLLGIRCRYNGEAKPCEKVIALSKKEILIPICPEQLGGLPTPRMPCEQKGDKVFSKEGKDITEQFKRGAEETLKIAKSYDIKEAILKQKSPSCGHGLIPDGTFSDKLIKGNGVTSQLLEDNGIRILSEDEL